jgi:hypothetical protein
MKVLLIVVFQNHLILKIMTYATLILDIAATWYDNFTRKITGQKSQDNLLELASYFENDKNSANVFKIASFTGKKTIVMPANSRLLNVFIDPISAAPTFKIGSTDGGEDYLTDGLVGDYQDWGGKPSKSGETIYLEAGGTGTVQVRYELKTTYIP